MKRLLLMFVLLSSLTANAQDIKDVLRKTRYFEIENDRTKEANYEYVLNYLLDNDFMIDQRDHELGLITTQLKNMKGHAAIYNFRIQDNKITLSGLYRQSQSNAVLFGSTFRDGFEQIQKRGGMSNRPGEKKAFEGLFNTAKDLGGNLTFRE